MMAFTVLQNVSAVVMTSSPAVRPAAIKLRCMAAVHELTAAAWLASLVLRELALEPGNPRTRPEPARLHCRGNLCDLLLPERGPAKHDEGFGGSVTCCDSSVAQPRVERILGSHIVETD